MMDEIGKAFTIAKSVKDIVSVVMAAKIDAEAKEKVYEALSRMGELHENLLSIREKLGDLQDENNALKQLLSEKEAFDSIMAQYALVETKGGAVVYEFSGSPKHYACPRCIASKKEIHILQDTRTISGKYECSNCKSLFHVNPRDNSGGRAIIASVG